MTTEAENEQAEMVKCICSSMCDADRITRYEYIIFLLLKMEQGCSTFFYKSMHKNMLIIIVIIQVCLPTLQQSLLCEKK